MSVRGFPVLQNMLDRTQYGVRPTPQSVASSLRAREAEAARAAARDGSDDEDEPWL